MTVKPSRLTRLDAWLGVLIVGLVVATAAVLVVGRAAVAGVPALDLTINVAATLVGAAVALLAWARWRETRASVALFESGAFGGLSAVNALVVVLVIVGADGSVGLEAGSPGKAPMYLWLLARVSAAVLLVAGAARQLRGAPAPLAALVAVGPAVVLLVMAPVLLWVEGSLPALRSATGGPAAVAALAGGPTPWFVVLQLAIVAVFGAAAVLFRRLYRQDGVVSHAYLAGGLVVAAFSQLHFAIEPAVAAGVVTSADALRLLFHAVLFFGIQAEIHRDLADLRGANAELRRLREVEAGNAALGERARLAREIHDGLAQDLWWAKLEQSRVLEDPELSPSAARSVREVLKSIDAALADARQAVMALRLDRRAEEPLVDVLRSYLDDFGDRYGIQTRFQAGDGVARMGARTEAELIRVVQEALNNVRKHADATVARVSLETVERGLRVIVADNGRGFDPSVSPDGRFGLRGMKERCELMGGKLTIDSRPADGTRLIVDVPVDVA